jgi:hypothetical protein
VHGIRRCTQFNDRALTGGLLGHYRVTRAASWAIRASRAPLGVLTERLCAPIGRSGTLKLRTLHRMHGGIGGRPDGGP